MASTAVLLKLPLEDLTAAECLLPSPLPCHHPCAACGSRPARFQYRGIVKADRSHTLCFQCFRAAVNRVRLALRMVEPQRPAAIAPGPRAPRLRGAPQDEANAAKYDELARRRRHAQIAARHAIGG